LRGNGQGAKFAGQAKKLAVIAGELPRDSQRPIARGKCDVLGARSHWPAKDQRAAQGKGGPSPPHVLALLRARPHPKTFHNDLPVFNHTLRHMARSAAPIGAAQVR